MYYFSSPPNLKTGKTSPPSIYIKIFWLCSSEVKGLVKYIGPPGKVE